VRQLDIRATIVSISFIIVIILAYIDNFSIVTVISPYAQSLGASGILLGMIVAGYSLAEDIFETFVGYITDRIKKLKAVLVAGMITNSLVIILYLYVYSPYSLLLIRLLHGTLGALIGPTTMALARYIPSPFKGLGGRMGLYGFGIMISTSIGFPLGGIVTAYFGRETLFTLIATIIFIGGLLSITLPSPKIYQENPEKPSIHDWLMRGKQILRDIYIVSGLLTIFGMSFVSGAITTLLPNVSSAYVESGEIALSTYLGLTAIIAMILQIPIGLLADKVNRLKMILIGMLMIIIGLILLTKATSILELGIAAIPYGIGYAILFPTTATLILSRVSRDNTAYASGLYHLMFTEGIVWGAIYSGSLYSWINPLNTLYVSITPLSIAFIIGLSILLRREEIGSLTHAK
jgi:MFS family permease